MKPNTDPAAAETARITDSPAVDPSTSCCASLFVRLSGINLAKIILGAAVIPGGAFLSLATVNLEVKLAGFVICWLGGGAVMLLAIAANRTADIIQHNDKMEQPPLTKNDEN